MAKIVHHAIAHVARSLATEAYEVLARNNRFYARWPEQEGFVIHCWDMFIADARIAMTDLLTKDYTHFPLYTKATVDKMKADIYEALVLDGTMKGAPDNHPLVLH